MCWFRRSRWHSLALSPERLQEQAGARAAMGQDTFSSVWKTEQALSILEALGWEKWAH